jgi:hypothetical protein
MHMRRIVNSVRLNFFARELGHLAAIPKAEETHHETLLQN